MMRSHWIVIPTVFLFFDMARAADFAEVRTFPTHSRLIVKIDDSVTTFLKKNKTGFELRIKGVNGSDLGFNSTPEDTKKTEMIQVNDPRVENLEIKETSDSIWVRGKWKFPTGELALAKPDMETFDFREKSPPLFSMDFWVKPGLTMKQVESKLKEEAYQAERKRVRELTEKKQARRLASIKQEEAYLSSMRVCEIPMSYENDIYLRFNPIHQKVDFARWIPQTTADNSFTYYRPTKKTRDAKYVRLGLDLYKTGRWGLVVRTLDFLDKEYPQSNYLKEMKFLRANAYLRLGLDHQANSLLKKIVADYDKEDKGTSASLYSAVFLAGRYIKNHLTLAAMEQFLWIIQNYPDYPDNWVFHLGIAESLYELKQTEKAIKEYQWVIDNGPTDHAKAEAAFRMGDLFMERFQYEQALATYSAALRDLTAESRHFPAFFLNRGEALFQLGQHEIAEQVFMQVIKEFPSHPQSWRASFRLGEIEAKNTKDPMKIADSRQWFYDTINHYPLSPGATLARIRLLPCGDHASMDPVSSEEFFTKTAVNFDGAGEVVLKDYNDFRALAHIRSLVTLGPEENIGTMAFEELNQVKNPLARKKIILVATESIQRKVMKLINEGKQYEALSYYTVMSPLIDKDVESERVDYLLALSECASNIGLGTFAEKLSKIYLEKLTNLKKRPHRVLAQIQNADNQNDLEFELKRAEEQFAEAKAIWVSDSITPASLELVKAKLQEVKEESKFFFEKEIILGLIAEKQANPKEALVHAATAHLQKKSLRVLAWLAILSKKADDPKDALNFFGEVEKSILESKNRTAPEELVEDNLGVPPVPSLAWVTIQEAEILEKMDKWPEASEKYSEAISNGIGGNQFVFQYARSLIKIGEPKEKEKALDVLEKLSTSEAKNEKEEFWKRMAQAALSAEKGNPVVN